MVPYIICKILQGFDLVNDFRVILFILIIYLIITIESTYKVKYLLYR